jgi:MoaA/NifB/PqqE/SkfB family radical SAM enzyme
MEKQKYILDGSKILWHQERLAKWVKGEKFAPITIDMALTQACQYNCEFCYAKLQRNKPHKITWQIMEKFLEECAKLEVKAISLVSDGESTANPIYEDVIVYGKSLGIDMALGTHGNTLNERVLRKILPSLTYLRFNFSAGEPERYAQIMGVEEKKFFETCENIKTAVKIKKELNLDVTIGMQMVLMPQYGDQIIPLAKLAKKLKPDYLVIKHCSDDENGSLGLKYEKYAKLYPLLKEAENLSDDDVLISVKWSKITCGRNRSYSRCYGPPFHLQISGTGLVAPCGSFFNEKYKKFHIANITEDGFSFEKMIFGEKYWKIMKLLASEKFDAKTMCETLCLQHKTNEILDAYKKGRVELKKPSGKPPVHINFI